MKRLQLLTFLLAALPSTPALVLNTGISSNSSTLSGPYNTTSISSTSSSFSASASFSSTSILPGTTTSASNGAPIQPTTSPAFPGAPTTSAISAYISSPRASSNTSTNTGSAPYGSSPSISPSGTAAGPQSSSSASSLSRSSPTGAASRPIPPSTGSFGLKSVNSSSGAIFPTHSNHILSSMSGFFPSGHVSYHLTTGAHKLSGIPMATGTGGASPGSSRLFPPSGTGYTSPSSGAAKGIFPPSGTGQGSTGSGAPKGVFPPSGMGQGTASGTGVLNGIFPPSGTGQIRGSGTGIPKGVFPPNGTNPKLTASGGANSSMPTRAATCGHCEVMIPQLQVLYFQATGTTPNATCTQSPGTGPAITPPPAPALVRRRLDRRNGTFVEGILVSNNYTFTSPSMYVAMSQGIHVTDDCGTLGSSMATAVVPVSDLSTISYNLPSGAVLSSAVLTASTYTKPLRTEDLACPTWGISGNWNPRPDSDPLVVPGGAVLNVPVQTPGATALAILSYVDDNTHVGAPWYPIILLPHDVLSLQPAWKSCVGRLRDPAFPVFDPPQILHAEQVLVSSSNAPAEVQAQITGGGSESAPLPMPTSTGGPGGVDNGPVKVAASALVAGSTMAPAPPSASATVQGVAPPLAETSRPQSAAAANPPAANPPASSAAAQNQGFMQSLSAALAVSSANAVPAGAANSPPTNPPTGNPPAGNPPAGNPPAGNPPAGNPPAGNPPAGNPPAGNQPTGNAPAANPPATNAVTANSPIQANVANQPAANPPAANPPAAAAPTPLSVGGQQVGQQGNNLVVAGQSIAPGSTANVAGHQVVNNGNNVVVDGSSQAIQANPTPAPAPLPVVGGQQVQQQGSNLVVAGQSIAPGSSANVAGHQVVNNGNNLVVDGSSQAIQANPTPAPAPLPVVGGQQVQQQGSNLVVAGQSIAPGGSANVAGHQVVNNGNNIVVDGSSQAIQATPAPAPLPAVGGQQVQQQGSNLVVAGQSIAPGSTANVAGHQVVNNGNNIIVDGSSQAIQATPAPVYVAGTSGAGAAAGGVAPAFQGILPASAAAPLPSVGGQQIQQQGSNLVVAGQTITPGASTNVAGHQVANNGNALVVDGSSQALPPAGVTAGPAAAPAVTIGGTPYTADTSGNFIVNGQTLNGNTPITVSGTPISILPGSSAVAIGSETHTLTQPTSGPAAPIISVGGTPYTADGAGNFVIGGQTLNPSNPITVSGTPISILPGNSAVAVGSSTQAIVTPPPDANNANSPAQVQPPLTIDGSTYYPTGPSSAYILPGGQTLTPGAQITVGSTPVSLASDGSAAVVGGSTENLAPTITPPPGHPALTIDGMTYHPTGASSAYVIGGQTLIPGSGPITVSGTPISLAANGATAVVGSSTENLQPPITAPSGLIFDGTTYQPTSVPGASSAYVINGQTIIPGAAPVTVSGTPVSLASDGATAVVGGITEHVGASAAPEPAITFGGSTYHPITGEPSDYVVGSQTLTPGGVITVSGTPISLATNGASAVIGSSTQNLQMTKPPLIFGGSTYYPIGPSSDYVIDGQTITPGASVTISGTPISLASNGASAVVGTSTEDLLPSLTSGAVLTVGGQTFTPNPSSFVVGGKTMAVGGSAIISGTPVVLEPGGTLMVGTSEIPLATASGKLTGPSGKPLTGSAAQEQVPWMGMALGLVGTGFLYIL